MISAGTRTLLTPTPHGIGRDPHAYNKPLILCVENVAIVQCNVYMLKVCTIETLVSQSSRNLATAKRTYRGSLERERERERERKRERERESDILKAYALHQTYPALRWNKRM